ncbi:hypothetical protein P6166_06875 [Stenotrophomonas sp. HITSZ_GD]|uniref:hypothetical protein n=1 Tax=Stenotrophomonas sp. HITSZ_GD TaxID=3037248 RepID=UPI00240D603D|nr:hypothetical protein [Stenotrophomonas sp. HITSZ_GD]MDG2525076.1 hypothetical protein [Stenotrophomonas sp. HITSZ_GD]
MHARALLIALLVLATPAVAAQTPAPAASAEPAYAAGDAWIDRQLEDIDAYAQRYPASFVDELARYLDVRRGYADAVLKAPGWRAGDLYFACAWAQATHQPCRTLVRARSDDVSRAWQAVLATQGEPDNLAYRAVRHAIVASYDRWERPIVLDARLREQLGDAAQRLARARAAHAPAEAADAP